MSEEKIERLPNGFVYEAMVAGIKKSGKLDLSLIASTGPAVAAGVYTQNLVHATSIDWCRSHTPSDQIRAIVVNSGNANACTGTEGENNNRRLAELAGRHVGCQAEQVLVLSTGVIGRQLPMPLIEAAWTKFPTLSATHEAYLRAADGITTTDNRRKVATGSFEHRGQTFSVANMAKGAGMIGPNMATMLAVVTTDFPLSKSLAQAAVTMAANHSFNRISVEGHTSTNDALVLLSSRQDPQLRADDEGFQKFLATLQQTCLTCAKLIPADGEGATHLMNIRVHGASHNLAADQIARAIANSALVKCAVHGNDPNWGRIVSAAGYAGVDFDPAAAQLRLNGHLIFAQGRPESFDAKVVSQSIRDSFELEIDLCVGVGSGSATHYSSDLTVDYVKFNSEYTT
ncbi:MAG: bifunctional glutamate N-acetyltransferase/amino-acid acetyltransferase ArgJ [Planctomycetaceae bacterium]|nr:bifunctional glutamate N-acetyltransferase/amino-acid acetyltransferase ArgJ [Planctomycetaceae bacterium]